MAFQNMVNMQLMMFLLVGIGFFVRKKGIIGGTARKELVNFCLYITLPFNIFHSFRMDWDSGMLTAFLEVLLLSIGYNVIGMLKKCRTLFVHNGKKQPALHLNPHVSAIFLQFPKPANLPRSRGISTPPAELPKVMTST